MNRVMFLSRALVHVPRKPLAAAFAAFFALTIPDAIASTFVTNCNDAGAGSLRGAVTAAASGETVDATGLKPDSPGCSKSVISLKTGTITIGQADLTIVGPGQDLLTVSAKYINGSGTPHQYPYRIFTHTGSGTLTVKDMSLIKGYARSTTDDADTGDANGGCVYSTGSVSLERTSVEFCSAKATIGTARGGGVYASNDVALVSSQIRYNTVNGNYGGRGGGVLAYGNFSSHDSTIDSNLATNATDEYGFYGGVGVRGSVMEIVDSTISNNRAAGAKGGVAFCCSGRSVTVTNSTISGNTASNDEVGGIAVVAEAFTSYNSTIAFNSAHKGTLSDSPGLALYFSGSGILRLESTLISNNDYGDSIQNDISAVGAHTTIGTNNLIRTPGSGVPDDTIVGKCPLLKPLANNGGRTNTHALYSHSPAIDAGNNVALLVSTNAAQRRRMARRRAFPA